MSCSANEDGRFVITRGVENTFIFTIKANNSTLPIVIDSGDTFQSILRDIVTGDIVITKSLTVESAENGRVRLVYSQSETGNMTPNRGPKEDRFYLRPVYSLTLVCSTLVNGDFLAKVNSVYVD